MDSVQFFLRDMDLDLNVNLNESKQFNALSEWTRKAAGISRNFCIIFDIWKLQSFISNLNHQIDDDGQNQNERRAQDLRNIDQFM